MGSDGEAVGVPVGVGVAKKKQKIAASSSAGKSSGAGQQQPSSGGGGAGAASANELQHAIDAAYAAADREARRTCREFRETIGEAQSAIEKSPAGEHLARLL